MKKIILIITLFIGISKISYSQKPMIGFTKEEIINENIREYGNFNYIIEKIEDDNFWVLYCEYETHYSVYYFENINYKNVLFTHFIRDEDLAESIYTIIRLQSLMLGDNFFKEDSGMYIYVGRIRTGEFTFTWSDKIIPNLIK